MLVLRCRLRPLATIVWQGEVGVSMEVLMRRKLPHLTYFLSKSQDWRSAGRQLYLSTLFMRNRDSLYIGPII